MIFTLGDAKAFCAKYVADGRSEDDPLVVSTIDEATMILLNEGDWKSTVKTMRFNVKNNSFALPREVETVLQVAFDNSPSNVRSRAYEYLEGGPGILNCGNIICASDIVDMGDGFPTFWPIGGAIWHEGRYHDAADVADTSRKLIFISNELEDTELDGIRVQGYGDYKNRLMPQSPGEIVEISHWKGGVEGVIREQDMVYSENNYVEIASIIKPVTKGYVSLYAVDPVTRTMLVLGKYHPDETQPSYRRYKITGRASASQVDCVTCRVKLRYLPATYDQDVILIQNLPALRVMCQSIHQRNLGNTQEALMRQADATRMLDKQLENVRVPNYDFNVIMHTSMGSIPEMQ